MSTTAPGVPVVQQSTEEKIDQAISEAAQIVNHFSPGIATAIAAGAEVEPVISAMVHMFISLFRHKMAKPATGQ